MKNNKYFEKFLKVVPVSLAIWRAIEAYQLSKLNVEFKRPILDIGCGFGEFAGVYFERQVEVGIDIDDKDILRARQIKKYKKLVLADARKLPFKNNYFKTVISNSVLEHIPDVGNVFSEIFRVLKPGGYLIYTVPLDKLYDNLFYTSFFEMFGLSFLAKQYFNLFNKVFKHVNMFPKEKWLKLTENAGFEIVIEREIISPKATKMFDLTILPALPSQISRWLLGHRFVISIPGKIWLSNKLFGSLITENCLSGSNFLVVARKGR